MLFMMIMFGMIIMNVVIIMVVMTAMIIMVVMHMHLAVKVLSFTPYKSGANSGLNGERTTIA